MRCALSATSSSSSGSSTRDGLTHWTGSSTDTEVRAGVVRQEAYCRMAPIVVRGREGKK